MPSLIARLRRLPRAGRRRRGTRGALYRTSRGFFRRCRSVPRHSALPVPWRDVGSVQVVSGVVFVQARQKAETSSWSYRVAGDPCKVYRHILEHHIPACLILTAARFSRISTLCVCILTTDLISLMTLYFLVSLFLYSEGEQATRVPLCLGVPINGRLLASRCVFCHRLFLTVPAVERLGFWDATFAMQSFGCQAGLCQQRSCLYM
ncbi:hypothetical protein MAPG_06798 [Magnaporthiopsis poae ATCC 64411]|uniref:Uncharacterized protein n=1 Tax=Magnaporthiopsis poae (strain ATCC 64411 / 73-15) TaxID=644358 RepID=A0A0C4E305_MAGP6|nr:hypothetical protein MAPG_06798 [Magnaporthiopsis poae ATCC 64411]